MTKKRNLHPICVVPLLLVLGGCMQHTYEIGTGAPAGEIVYKNWHHHWLFGLIRPQLQEVLDVDKQCPSGNATIHEEMSFVNGIVDILAFFIYSPTTVTIRCANGDDVEVEVSQEQAAALAGDPVFLQIVEELVPERLTEARQAISELRAAGRTSGTGMMAK